MPVYHSSYNKYEGAREACGCLLLPLKNAKAKGPAGVLEGDENTKDIVDEALFYFRANILYRNYAVDGGADRVLLYLSMFITKLLSKLVTCTSRTEAEKAARDIAMETFLLPGDPGFVLGGHLFPPKDSTEREAIRQYFSQVRQEVADRLVAKCFPDGTPNKWWLSFSKRKFLGATMTK